MANNNAFIDAIVAGAGGGAQNAILQATAGQYATFVNAISTIATAVDALIPPIVPGPSYSKIKLMETITAAVFHGRVSASLDPSTYVDIALDIVALYTQLSSTLSNQPDVYPPVVSGIQVINGTYAARPAPSVAGRLYICIDNPFRYYDTGAAWIQLVDYITTTPPPPAASFTPINVSTLTLSQIGDSIKVVNNGTFTNKLQYFKLGAISKGSSGEWTITVGLCNVNFSSQYDAFGLVVDDGTNYASTCVFRSDRLWGIYEHQFAGNPNNKVASTSPLNGMYQDPRAVYWFRYRCDGTTYYVDFSYDGYMWFNSDSGATYGETWEAGGAGPCDHPTHYGIGSSYLNAPSASVSPMSAIVCHLVNTPTFTPL